MITAEQRELRRKYIGSSDAPALFGLDPFKTAADVWLSKTGRADDGETTEAQERGNLLEPAIIGWAARDLGRNLSGSFLVQREDAPELCANLDAFLKPCDLAPGGAVIEAKTSTNPDEWGEPGTDEVPERVIVQTHHAMWVVGEPCRAAYVPVLMPLFGRFTFRMYRVERDDALAHAVASRGIEFHRKYIQGDTPPPDVLPSLDVLKRVRREPNKVVPLADELVDNLIAARAAKKQACDDAEEAERAVLAALGEAEGGTYSRGQVTYLETKRKAYTVAEGSYRTLRIKKG